MGPFLAVVAVATVSAFVAWVLSRRAMEVTVRKLEIEVTALRGQLAYRDERLGHAAANEVRLRKAEGELAAERAVALEREGRAEELRQSMRLEFEALSRRVLEERSRTLVDESQRGVEAVVAPLRERLKEFADRVQATSDQDNRDRGALLEKLRGLQEAQTRLHADAQALTRALTTDSKAQGDWGELVLESLLSTAGLTEGREYELQVDRHDPENGGHRRPDAIVYLPPDRALIVDSKCSLTAFVASTKEPIDEERERALEAHVQSLRTHIKSLSNKDYQLLIGQRTLELVFLFMPSEAAFHAAVSRDPSLYEFGLRQRVVITSPTTLLATLQVVSHVWRSERQTQNAHRIAQEAGKMIEKLALSLESFHEVGERLQRANLAFEEARNRLVTGRGNALQLARKVMALGARPPHPERVASIAQRLDADFEEELDQLDFLTAEGPDQ